MPAPTLEAMADVTPIPALRFAGVAVGDVIAPPFDVISPEEQARLYDRSVCNVVRLELGREADPYAEAERCYRSWRASGVLRQDPPSYYPYRQRFTAAGQEHERMGLFARVKLEPWEAGVVLPHEATHGRAKEDRLRLMRALRANISPVFGLYEDPGGELRRLLKSRCDQPPAAEAIDDAGESHALWQVADPAFDAQLREFFSGRQLFIADGHHRYETALAYRDEAGTEAARYVLMALVDFGDPGLVVLPTHRLLYGLAGDRLQRLSSGLNEFFEVVAAADAPTPRALDAALRQAASQPAPAFVLYGPLPSGLRVLVLKEQWRGTAFDSSRSAAWNALDVSVIHAVIGRALELSAEDVTNQRYFRYEQEPPRAVSAVQRGDAQIALLLRPTPATAIRDVALAGDKMPQKSTYFYPKLATGLVINPLD